jgi:hypothetical protein
MTANRRRWWPVGSAMLIAASMMAAACSNGAVSHPPGTHVVLQRGNVAGKGWKLVAWEDGKYLALWLKSPSGHNYVGAEDFSNTGPPPPTGFWTGSTGPGNVVFDFGPAPMSAARARLTAPRSAPVMVTTRLLPSGYGLPHARYFIARLRGPDKYWKVTLLDGSGHKVPFRSY